jgi:hypothetical protein
LACIFIKADVLEKNAEQSESFLSKLQPNSLSRIKEGETQREVERE